jgi:bidirectional [NiFe] hydrogenase diaphorase subunit
MKKITINGIPFNAEDNWTILEVAQFLGIEIPTLCHKEGLTPWGGCRLCLVEIGKAPNSKLVSSCTYPITEGLYIQTDTPRVIHARKVIIELLISQVPSSKTLQDIASNYGVKNVRFKSKNDKCIYCGLCVRMCHEQMRGDAIGFVNRGKNLKISSPFNKSSAECRRCGGCMYICPICMGRCEGSRSQDVLCNRCYNNVQITHLNVVNNYLCCKDGKNKKTN